MSQIYSTTQAAETLSCSAEAIRSQKSRKSSQFIEGTHYIKQGQATMWLDTGLELLRSLIKADIATEFPAGSVAVSDELLQSATPNVAALTPDLLQPIADPLAEAWIRQNLPVAIRAAVLRLLTSADEADQVRLQQILESLGIILATAALSQALSGAIADSRKALQGV